MSSVSIANQPALSGTPDELMAMLIAAPSPVALTFLRQGATAPPGAIDASAAAAAEVAAAADAASRSATPSDPPPAAAPAPATSDGGGGRRGSTGYGSGGTPSLSEMMRMDRERAAAAAAPAAAGVPRSNSRERQTPSPATSEAEGASAGFEALHLMQAMRASGAAPAVAAAAARGTPGRTRPKSAPLTAEQLGSAPRPISAPPEEPAAALAPAPAPAAAPAPALERAWAAPAAAPAPAPSPAEALSAWEAAMSAADAQQAPPPTAAAGRPPSAARARGGGGGVTSKLKAFESRDAPPPAAGGKSTKPASPPPGHPAYVPGRDLFSKERPAAAAATTTTPAAAQGSSGSSPDVDVVHGKQVAAPTNTGAPWLREVKSRPLRSREASPATGRPPEDASAARDEQPAAAAVRPPLRSNHGSLEELAATDSHLHELRSVLTTLADDTAASPDAKVTPSARIGERVRAASDASQSGLDDPSEVKRLKSERASLYKQLEHKRAEMASLVKTSVTEIRNLEAILTSKGIEPPPRIAPLPVELPPSPAAIDAFNAAGGSYRAAATRPITYSPRAPSIAPPPPRTSPSTRGDRRSTPPPAAAARCLRCACASSRPRRARRKGRRRPSTAPRSR